MSVQRYLDCSTAHFTASQLGGDAVSALFAMDAADYALVLPHPHGAWINVPGSEPAADEPGARFAAENPNLVALMRHARAQGCWWINADADGNTIPGLPLFDW